MNSVVFFRPSEYRANFLTRSQKYFVHQTPVSHGQPTPAFCTMPSSSAAIGQLGSPVLQQVLAIGTGKQTKWLFEMVLIFQGHLAPQAVLVGFEKSWRWAARNQRVALRMPLLKFYPLTNFILIGMGMKSFVTGCLMVVICWWRPKGRTYPRLLPTIRPCSLWSPGWVWLPAGRCQSLRPFEMRWSPSTWRTSVARP